MRVDKGYGVDVIRREFASADIEAVALAKSNCGNPVPLDQAKYRLCSQVRHLITISITNAGSQLLPQRRHLLNRICQHHLSSALLNLCPRT